VSKHPPQGRLGVGFPWTAAPRSSTCWRSPEPRCSSPSTCGWSCLRQRYPRARLALVALLLADAAALSIADRPAWAYLFTYCAASSVLVGPPSMTFPAVLVCAALSVGCSLVGGSAATALGAGASTLGVGLVMVLMRDLRQRGGRDRSRSTARGGGARPGGGGDPGLGGPGGGHQCDSPQRGQPVPGGDHREPRERQGRGGR